MADFFSRHLLSATYVDVPFANPQLLPDQLAEEYEFLWSMVNEFLEQRLGALPVYINMFNIPASLPNRGPAEQLNFSRRVKRNPYHTSINALA